MRSRKARRWRNSSLKGTVQWTAHSPRFDLPLSGSLGYVFKADGTGATVNGIGNVFAAGHDFVFGEYGLRVGWKATDRLTVDAFLVGTSGESIGTHIQGGTGLRLKF